VTQIDAFRAADQFLPPTAAAWRHATRKARTLYPLDKPLRIVRRRPPGATAAEQTAACWYGLTDEDEALVGHVIYIDPRLPLNAAIDGLLHELAHAWCEENGIDVGPNEAEHSDAFWLVFGKFYRAWMQETKRW
jgi:hypothetical protein